MPKRKLEGKIIYQSIPDTDNVKRKYDDIHRDLLSIRKNNINTESLVRILEYEKYLEDVLDEQRLDFCKLYTKKLLEKYLKSLFEKDIYFKCALDFLCAIYGFKKDFEPQKDPLYMRYKKYWENEKSNLLFYNIKKESNVDSEFGKIDREIIDELAKIITLSVFETGDGEKLNFLNDKNFSLIKREVQASRRDNKGSSLQKQRGDTIKQPQDPNLQELNINKPDSSAPVKVDIESDKLNSPIPPEPEDEIAKYIAKTQTASYHDEFSHEIYAALCHEGESPYSEWVATWLLKCIKKKFKGCNAKQDLMNASFALLVGYELDINNEDQLRCRLHRYLNQSGFAKLIEKNPDPQKRFYSEITDNQLREQVLDIALKYELSYFAELMGYIKTIRTPEKHIKKLDKFGRYNADYSAYAYKPQKIHITERSIDIKEFVDRTEKRINSFLCLLVISIVFTGISIFYLSNKPLSYQSIINPEDESGRPTISFDSTPLDGGGGRQNDLTYGKVSNHLLDIVNKYMLDLLTSREDS